MKCLATLIVAFSACAPSSPIATLADLRNARIEGTDGGFGIVVGIAGTCFELSSEVHGTVDGAPLTIYRGGLQETPDADVCAGMNIALPSGLANNAVTTLELSDDDTTWSFGVERLAPSQWTVTAPSQAVEGSDVTVSF